MPSAGLIYGPESHHLDHLAPLCALLEIPLILTEAPLAKQVRDFYPDLEILHWDPHETPDRLVANYSTIYCSIPRPLFDQVFYLAQGLQQKRVRTIWCPHGNSDKGRSSPFMEALRDEELLLTYGPRMETFLKEKGVTAPTCRIGNYRLAYYEKHRVFYDRVIRNRFPKKRGKTLLYAPTWQDEEKNSSFLKLLPHLLDVPEAYSLIIKFHPNLYLQYPEEIKELKQRVYILEDFPPIYPLLTHIDLYIGDMSSIGYDFLAFNKPMLLLNDRDSLKEAGTYLPSDEYPNLFEYCRDLLNEGAPKNSLYEETFSPFQLNNLKKLEWQEQ